MLAELIFTGSELVQGRALNTHSQYLGQWLTEHNFEVGFSVTVGDQEDRLEQAFRQALARAEVILLTGGLGPTTDDLTKEIVARVLGLPMVLDQESLAAIKAFFRARGLDMPESNIRQAYFPQGAKILPNKRGTAPGALLEKDKKIIALLPGPPRELTAMLEESLGPILLRQANFSVVNRSKVLKVTGIAESAVQDLLLDLGGQGNPGLSYLASPGQLLVRLSGRAAEAGQAEKMVEDLAAEVGARLADYIFGYGSENIEEVVGKQLLEKNLTIGLAESCTGGLIAARLIDIPGSSAYVAGGVVAYSNELKSSLLGVPAELIETHGAVSAETAEAMARGARQVTSADLGLAVTGIAGPEGDTPTKPVGLVYIALAHKDGLICRRCHFPGNRLAVRVATVNTALLMVKKHID